MTPLRTAVLFLALTLFAVDAFALAEPDCPALFAAGKYQDTYRQIIREKLNRGRASQFPHLVFTAGGFGAGKTTMLAQLNRDGNLHIENYVALDVDEIKELLPEYRELKISDPLNAADRVHDLSGCIAREVFKEALVLGKNILVDGSMRLTELWKRQLLEIRRDHPAYLIYILFVEASDAELLRRVRERAAVTGRHIPDAKVLRASAQARQSFQVLKDFADVTFEFENETTLRLKRRVRQRYDCAARLGK